MGTIYQWRIHLHIYILVPVSSIHDIAHPGHLISATDTICLFSVILSWIHAVVRSEIQLTQWISQTSTMKTNGCTLHVYQWSNRFLHKMEMITPQGELCFPIYYVHPGVSCWIIIISFKAFVTVTYIGMNRYCFFSHIENGTDWGGWVYGWLLGSWIMEP